MTKLVNTLLGTGSKHTERQLEILNGLKAEARKRGLWNFWLTDSERGYGLTTVEYAYLAEEMGKVPHRRRSLQLQRARYRQHGGD